MGKVSTTVTKLIKRLLSTTRWNVDIWSIMVKNAFLGEIIRAINDREEALGSFRDNI